MPATSPGRPFGLAHLGQEVPLDDDLGVGGDVGVDDERRAVGIGRLADVRCDLALRAHRLRHVHERAGLLEGLEILVEVGPAG